VNILSEAAGRAGHNEYTILKISKLASKLKY